MKLKHVVFSVLFAMPLAAHAQSLANIVLKGTLTCVADESIKAEVAQLGKLSATELAALKSCPWDLFGVRVGTSDGNWYVSLVDGKQYDATPYMAQVVRGFVSTKSEFRTLLADVQRANAAAIAQLPSVIVEDAAFQAKLSEEILQSVTLAVQGAGVTPLFPGPINIGPISLPPPVSAYFTCASNETVHVQATSPVGSSAFDEQYAERLWQEAKSSLPCYANDIFSITMSFATGEPISSEYVVLSGKVVPVNAVTVRSVISELMHARRDAARLETALTASSAALARSVADLPSTVMADPAFKDAVRASVEAALAERERTVAAESAN